MPADPLLGRPLIGVVTGVEDVLLDVAEDRFIRIVVRTLLGQTGPLQPQLPHHRPRCFRFDRMRRIAIQRDPHRLSRIPSTHALQELLDKRRTLAREEGPVDAAVIDVVEQEQIEPSARLLIPLEYQALGRRVTSAPIRLDRDGLDIEERQEGTAGAVAPPRPQAVQDHPPIGIGVEELAFDAPERVPPFFSTRRRCSRLIALTIRCRMR